MTPKSEPKAILITGGCGFIGTNLAIYLTNRDYNVRVLDNLSANSNCWTSNENGFPGDYRPSRQDKAATPTQQDLSTLHPDLSAVDVVVGDIRDKQVVERSLEGIHAVLHLAAQTSVVKSLEAPEVNWEINVSATLNLLEACRAKSIGRFIFASSNAVVGEQDPPIDELKIPQPLSPYGAAKLAVEALCSAYYHSFDLATTCLRFANSYGPYSEHKTSVITRFLKRARENESLLINGDGKQTRDFIHVDDVCQAIHLCLESDDRIAGEVFQIATGVETSINQLAEMIIDIVESGRPTARGQLSLVYQPKQKGEIERNYSDISKARRILGFEPKIMLKPGLEELYRLHFAPREKDE